MSEKDVRHAFANWLQNVLNMPVASSNPAVKALCDKVGIGMEDLVGMADANDVNLSLVDDWAADYMNRERSEAGA